jgi:Htaa
MSVHRRVLRTLTSFCALTALVLSIAPAGASAHGRWHQRARSQTFGHTSLALDPGTASTLTHALGLSVAPISPAYASANGALNFPITNSLGNAGRTGAIDHSGGIAISGGGNTVDLTNFVISVPGKTLTADVSVVNTGTGTTSSLGAVTIVTLDFSGAHLSYGRHELSVGPVAATLNSTALTALGHVFGVSALGSTITSLPLGTATVHYRLFPVLGF